MACALRDTHRVLVQHVFASLSDVTHPFSVNGRCGDICLCYFSLHYDTFAQQIYSKNPCLEDSADVGRYTCMTHTYR
jgi:hypothetical protein